MAKRGSNPQAGAAQPLALVYRNVGELIPYARNSRTHSDAQIAQIAASIREFGWTNPILLDGERGIIAGHGRVLAARKLDIDSVPCIELAHLTPAQRRAYIIADNKLALNAGWDNEFLKVEFAELSEDGFDLNLTGFSDAERDQLLFGTQIGATDADAEWKGMPEYIDPDPCFRKVVVNFDDAEAVAAFFDLIEQECTDKTKSIWYPEKERRDLKSQEWTEDEES